MMSPIGAASHHSVNTGVERPMSTRSEASVAATPLPQRYGGASPSGNAPLTVHPQPISSNPFDEIPAVATGYRPPDGGLSGGPSNRANSQFQGDVVESSQLVHFDQIMANYIHQKVATAGPPERVNTDSYSALVQVFGVYTASCLLSKRYQLREAAGQVLCERADEILTHVSSQELLDAICVFLSTKGHGIGDPIASVFFTNIGILFRVIHGQFHGDSVVSLKAHGNTIIERLVEKLGDSNVRIGSSVKDSLLSLAKLESVGAEKVCSAVIEKKGKAYRVVCDKNETVSQILTQIPPLTLTKLPSLELDHLMTKLVLPSLDHAHNEAREKAIQCLLAVAGLYGRASMDPYLAKLKQSQRKIVEDRLEATSQQQESSPMKGEPRLKRRIQQARQDDAQLSHGEHSTDNHVNNSVVPHEKSGAPIDVASSQPAISPPKRHQVTSLPERRQPPAPVPGECQFCKLADDAFYEHEELVQHFMSECPMLCTCPLCKLPVEIREVHWHLAKDCEHKERLKMCPRCLEAVRDTEYNDHIARKTCILHQEDVQVCPLCHESMPAGDAFWEVHVLTPPFCPSNPRTATES